MKLNICCGPNMFPGWVNLDKVDMEDAYLRHIRDTGNVNLTTWPEWQQRQVKFLREGGDFDFRICDIRKGLPFPDESVEAIYMGQAIEHFNPVYEVPGILKECHRVLVHGGPIRLTTPELPTIIDHYNSGRMERFSHEQPEYYQMASNDDRLAYILFGASGPQCTSEHFEGHFHVYSPSALGGRLREHGFVLNQQGSRVFAGCLDHGMSHSFAIEGIK